MIVKNIFDYCPSRRLQACYAKFQRSKHMMSTFQVKRVKIGAPAKYVGIFVTCVVLASCSSGQNAFFAQRDAEISQGYTWQKLDRCRPAKEDAPSIPIIGPDGRKLVCYILAPPQSDVVASAAATTRAITPAPLSTVTPTPTTTSDTNSGDSSISWNFSNF